MNYYYPSANVKLTNRMPDVIWFTDNLLNNLSSLYEKITFSHKFSTFFWSSFKEIFLSNAKSIYRFIVFQKGGPSYIRTLKLRLDHMRHPNPKFLAQSWGVRISKPTELQLSLQIVNWSRPTQTIVSIALDQVTTFYFQIGNRLLMSD